MPVNAMYDPYAAERNAMNPAALRRIVGAPTVDARVNELFGMQPGMDRLNFLPRYDSQQGWIAPNALYQVARALVSPGVAAQGGNVSPEDAVNFGGVVGSGGIGASALMRNPAPGPGRTVAQTVYHGSPHNFDAFDISKIGTGEGAQAYGHGLYVAESPVVAKQYAGDLSAAKATKPVGNVDLSRAYQILPNDVPGTLLAARRDFRALKDAGELSTADRRDFLTAVKNNLVASKGGKLYTVDLPDQHIANMLDWDKPLSQQPESVRKALSTIGLPVTGEKGNVLMGKTGVSSSTMLDKATGESVLDALKWKLGSDIAVSNALRDAGIPGIKYLDGGSRGAGEGTRNYVVFDDKLLKILSKE